MLDKHKVDIEVTLRSSAAIPGDAITGTAQVTVRKRIECTRVYVKLRCKEEAWIRRKRGRSSVTYEDSYEHFSTYTLFQGRALGDSSRGGCFLEEGVSEFPFAFTLPANLPATLDLKTSSGHAKIITKVTCVVDIPMGFDATKEAVITVYPAITQNLYHQGLQQTTPMGSLTSELYRCPCCPICGSGGTVTLSATAKPAVLALAMPGDKQPPCRRHLEMGNDTFNVLPPNSYTGKLLFTCENNTNQEVLGMNLKLSMFQRIRVKGHTEEKTTDLAWATTRMTNNPIMPGTTRYFAFNLPLRKEILATKGVAPSQTQFTGARLLLKASMFAGSKETESLVAVNPFVLTAMLDGSNRVPPPRQDTL